MITAEQFAEWKTHPVTEEIFDELRKSYDSLAERLIDGQSLGETAEETHAKTNRLVGNIEGLEQLLNISFAEEEVDNEVNETSGY